MRNRTVLPCKVARLPLGQDTGQSIAQSSNCFHGTCTDDLFVGRVARFTFGSSPNTKDVTGNRSVFIAPPRKENAEQFQISATLICQGGLQFLTHAETLGAPDSVSQGVQQTIVAFSDSTATCTGTGFLVCQRISFGTGGRPRRPLDFRRQ